MAGIILSIEVDDRGTIKVKQFSDEAKKAFKEMEEGPKRAAGFVDTLKAKWLELIAAYALIRTAVNWMELGAKALQTQEAFENVTKSMGVAGDTLIKKMKDAAYAIQEDDELMRVAAKGLAQGLSPDQIIKLTEAARTAARLMGVDVKEAMDRVTDAAITLQTRGLKAAFTIDANQVVEKYARNLGVTSAQLSEFGRIQAITNAITEENRRVTNLLGDALHPTLSEKIQKTNSYLKELKSTIGAELLYAFQGLAGSFYGFAAALELGAAQISKLFRLSNELFALNPLASKQSKVDYLAQAKFWEETTKAYEMAGVELARIGNQMLDTSWKGMTGELGRLIAEENKKIEDRLKKDVKAPPLIDPIAMEKLTLARMGLLTQSRQEEADLLGNIDLIVKADQMAFETELKSLKNQGLITSEIEKQLRATFALVEAQKQVAYWAETQRYPAYEAPPSDWETQGRQIVLDRQKMLIDLGKNYASIMKDTQGMIDLDKVETENYIAGFKNKMSLTQQEEALIRKTAEQRQYQMTTEYQYFGQIRDVWSSHLSAMLKGTESVTEGIKGMFKDMGDYFIDMVAKMAMNWLLFENMQGGGKFLGGGSGIGTVLGWVGSLFHEGGIIQGWKPIHAFQEGGMINRPTFGMIGEGGPEAVIPLKGGKIPFEGGRGDGYFVVINANDAKSFDDMIKRNPESILWVMKNYKRFAGTRKTDI
jgi:hypothetical protein